MINIVVIGAGNVGIHLCKAINKAKGLTLKQWYNRSKIQKINSLENIPFTNDITNLDNADIYIICVSDSAIENLSNDLQFKNRLVVHTSGSVSMRNLNKKNRRGVFYPLQSFSKEIEISFINVPICIEANDKKDRQKLEMVATAIGSPKYFIQSDQRKILHLAAVFVNNFTNQLYRISHELTDNKNINFDILKPLIAETSKKVQKLSPYKSQTGPAKRGDKKTIKQHCKLLEDYPTYKKIYELLTHSIQKTHG